MDYRERYAAWRSLPRVFFDKAAELGDKPFVWSKHDGAWQPLSWRAAGDQIGTLSRGLRTLGVAPGDRVALVSENRPEWVLAELAIMAARAIAVPAYTTNTVADHVHVLTDSGAKLAIVSTARLAERLLPAADQAGVEAVIALEAPTTKAAVPIHRWSEVQECGRGQPDDVIDFASEAQRTDISCLIYTSGTGGDPKGVMLSHGAILCNCMGAYHLFADADLLDLDREVFLSFLPLSHSYEHAAGLHFPISIGAEIYYAESVDRLVDNMAEARPTIMTAVPRLYEMMHQRIVAGVERKGGVSAALFRRAVVLGTQRYKHGARSLDIGERITDSVLDKLVRAKVAQRFGGRLKAFVSGGAPLNPQIGEFFLALGVRLLQGYGQTETAPVISCNPLLAIKIHTVGPPVRDVEVKIADDGEIIVRGELTMDGYWNNREATAEVLRDGWVHTGDIGQIDADGYVQITDRKKDIIVNSGGDNLSPARVETMLTFEPELAQAMVYGDRRPHLVAILVPDQQFAESWAKANGKEPDLALLAGDAEFHRALSAVVDRVNARLSTIEKVRRFVVAQAPFTTENGMQTPSLKIRRHKVKDHYGDELDALYAHGTAA